MALRPIGWICGEMVRKFAGQAEMIQRAFLEIIDEIRDEFPTLLRLTSSNQQQSDSVVQESGSIMSRVFSSAHGTIIMNGLTKLSKSSRSVARLLQPQLFRKFTELKMFSVCLLKNITTPKQSLYKMKDRQMFLYDVISYPAKTALTSLMCASYAVLIYLAFSINKVLKKIKSVIHGEKPTRESSSEGVDGDAFPTDDEAASFSTASHTPQLPSELTIKASRNSGSIYTLLSPVDQENE